MFYLKKINPPVDFIAVLNSECVGLPKTRRMANESRFTGLTDLVAYNRARVREIREHCEPNSAPLQEAMTNFYVRARKEWWLFLSGPVWLPKEIQLRTKENTESRMTNYGEAMASGKAAFDKAMEDEDTKSRLVALAGMIADWSWDLRPHLLMTGEGSTGISFVFDTVQAMADAPAAPALCDFPAPTPSGPPTST